MREVQFFVCVLQWSAAMLVGIMWMGGDRVIYQVLVLSEYFLKWEKLQSLLTQEFL